MKKTMVLCDLDDGEARPGVATVQLTVDGVTYDLDVCKVHLDSLSKLPVVEPRKATAARANGPSGKRPAARGARPKPPAGAARAKSDQRRPGSRRDRQERVAEARSWARAQGRDVADKGRLPTGLLEEFEASRSS